MNLNEYTEAALKTESKIDQVITNETRLLSILEILIGAGNMLDDLKKNIFYGREIDNEKYFKQSEMIKNGYFSLDLYNQENKELVNQNDISGTGLDIDPRIAHSIIGVNTEGTELLEALYTYIKTGDLDKVNTAEEIGDINWYSAILLDALNKDWEKMLCTNIKKLESRYQGSFSNEAANNRDLDTERKILEE